jgi:two-component system, OmpR family, response regulator
MRILIVEDDERMASAVRRGFEGEGVAVDVAGAGEEALWRAAATPYAAIVLDLMLPGIDGVETCRRLRAAEVWTPILMLTARGAVRDRVDGLNSGADDYLVKPFSFEELLARVRALVRRDVGPRPSVLAVGDLRLDPATHEVRRGDTPIALSAREVAILETFMRRPGRVLSRYDLLELVWDGEFDHRSNVVDVAVRRLRDKIDRPFGTDSIETVRRAGYRLCEPDGS